MFLYFFLFVSLITVRIFFVTVALNVNFIYSVVYFLMFTGREMNWIGCFWDQIGSDLKRFESIQIGSNIKRLKFIQIEDELNRFKFKSIQIGSNSVQTQSVLTPKFYLKITFSVSFYTFHKSEFNLPRVLTTYHKTFSISIINFPFFADNFLGKISSNWMKFASPFLSPKIQFKRWTWQPSYHSPDTRVWIFTCIYLVSRESGMKIIYAIYQFSS